MYFADRTAKQAYESSEEVEQYRIGIPFFEPDPLLQSVAETGYL